MEQTIRVQSLKDYENNLTPYYVKEIVPHVLQRKLFKIEDVGHLGASATQLGMGKIRAKTSMGKYVVEFLNKATIHGLNHLVAPRRHFIERILTILFLGIGLACLVVSSLHSWYQYQHNPTSMVLDFDFKNFNVTRAAITVCLLDKIAASKFPEVFKKFGVKDTPEARNFFIFISNPQYSTLHQTPIYNDTSPEKWLEIIHDLYVDFKIHSCQGIDLCSNANVSTADIVTERGLCTNTYGAYNDYVSVDNWLANKWTVFPQISLPASMYIRHDHRSSLFNIPGSFEETLHHPNEVPQYNDMWYQITSFGIDDLTIAVQQVESADDLKKLSQRQRLCNYPEDGKLKMFPVYTRNMCIMECRYNLIKTRCRCYPYFARPMPGTPICNATQLRCIGNLAKVLIALKDDGANFCNCPNNCNTANYKITSLKRQEFDQPMVGFTERSVNIDIQFPLYKLRHEVFFGFNEFLVSVGGAAGLFLGASIISFVEIFYYATLRLFWYKNTVRKHRRE